MVGDGQEHVDRPIYDDDGEMIVWPTLDEDMEEFAEEAEVATIAASDDATEDDTYYEVPDTVEDDQDRIDVQVESIEDEQCEDAKIGDIQQASESYDAAMDRIINILTQALSTEEMTEEMSAELKDATNDMETAKQTITDMGANPEADSSEITLENIKQNMVGTTPEAILDILTEGGTKPWLYKDDDNNILVDGTSIPQVTAVVKKLNLIATDGEDESSIQLAPNFIKLISNSDIVLKGSQIRITGDTVIDGLVTANNNFIIKDDGSISCKNAEIQGTITGTTIKGSEVIGTSFSVEGELTADTITANKINGGKFPSTLDDDIQIFVNSTNGNDDNELHDGVTFATIGGAIDALPKFLNGKVVNIIIQKNIEGNVDFQYFTSGRINLYLTGHTIYGYVRNYMSSTKVNVYGGSVDNSTDAIGIIHPTKGCAVAGRTGSLIGQENSPINAYNVKIYGSDNLHPSGNSGTVGIIVDSFGTGYYRDVQFTNCTVGFRGSAGARIHVASSNGVCSQYGFQVTSGAFITIANAAHCGGKTANTSQGLPGQIIAHDNATYATGEQTTDTNKAPTTTGTKVVTIKSNSADTYRSSVYNSWKKDNTARQGDYGYGDCNGCWFFGTQFNQFKGKNITKIELTIKRISGGSSAAVSLVVKTHNYTGRPSGKPSYGSSCGSVSIPVGSSAKLTITNSTILNALSNGTIKGFGIQSTYNSSNYAVCSGSITMKVTYAE